MSKHTQRPQKADLVVGEDTKPLVVNPLTGLDDRKRNPKDLEPDEAAMGAGVEHGGTIEKRANIDATRGSGGRKRS